MGSSPKAAKPAPTPPEPATLKRTETEVVQARNAAKNAATRRYGISGTNVTQGALSDNSADTKKNKLGGN
jgi:hypothetical protein